MVVEGACSYGKLASQATSPTLGEVFWWLLPIAGPALGRQGNGAYRCQCASGTPTLPREGATRASPGLDLAAKQVAFPTAYYVSTGIRSAPRILQVPSVGRPPVGALLHKLQQSQQSEFPSAFRRLPRLQPLVRSGLRRFQAKHVNGLVSNSSRSGFRPPRDRPARFPGVAAVRSSRNC